MSLDTGSHTTLVPLHKLYASTAPPTVWARSTGLEVLNELAAFKAGILGAAGGQSSAPSRRDSYGTVARGVEMVVGGVQVSGRIATVGVTLEGYADGVDGKNIQRLMFTMSKGRKTYQSDSNMLPEYDCMTSTQLSYCNSCHN
jgi:hypothetical protein